MYKNNNNKIEKKQKKKKKHGSRRVFGMKSRLMRNKTAEQY